MVFSPHSEEAQNGRKTLLASTSLGNERRGEGDGKGMLVYQGREGVFDDDDPLRNGDGVRVPLFKIDGSRGKQCVARRDSLICVSEWLVRGRFRRQKSHAPSLPTGPVLLQGCPKRQPPHTSFFPRSPPIGIFSNNDDISKSCDFRRRKQIRHPTCTTQPPQFPKKASLSKFRDLNPSVRSCLWSVRPFFGPTSSLQSKHLFFPPLQFCFAAEGRLCSREGEKRVWHEK